jgi:hypothetical protein
LLAGLFLAKKHCAIWLAAMFAWTRPKGKTPKGYCARSPLVSSSLRKVRQQELDIIANRTRICVHIRPIYLGFVMSAARSFVTHALALFHFATVAKKRSLGQGSIARLHRLSAIKLRAQNIPYCLSNCNFSMKSKMVKL